MTTTPLRAAVLAALLASSAAAQSWTRLAGPSSGVKGRDVAVARSQAEWDLLWSEHDFGRGSPPPEVDFTRDLVIAAWAEPGEIIELRGDESDPTRFYAVRRAAVAIPGYEPGPGRPFLMRKVPTHPLTLFTPVWIGFGAAEPGSETAPADAAPLAARSLEVPALGQLMRGFDAAAPEAGAFAEPAAEEKPSAKAKWRKQGWAVVVRGGPTFSQYSNADVKIDTKRAQLELKDVVIDERNDMSWYRPKNMKARPGHFIDEPSNDFTLGLENRRAGYAVNFTARHPKILVVEERTINQAVRARGTLDGEPVDRVMALDDVFSNWRLTHRFMNYQIQLEKLFTAAGSAGALTLAPGIAGGLYAGYANAGWTRPDGTLVEEHSAGGIIGKGLSGSMRLSYEVKRFSATAAYQTTKAMLRYPILDGTASHRLDSRTVTFQLGVTLFK